MKYWYCSCTNPGVNNLSGAGSVCFQMLFELEGYEDDLDYRSIPLSTKTPCSEAIPLIVKKYNLPGQASEYFLVEVSEENEGAVSSRFLIIKSEGKKLYVKC